MRETTITTRATLIGAAAALCICALLPAAASAQSFKVIPNEFNRDNGTLADTEYVEILLLERMTAAELGNYAFGDSLATTTAKNAIYQFQNMDLIATHFEAGTLIVIGGTTAIPTEDLTYNPWSGNNDWELLIQTSNTTYINPLTANTMDGESKDVVWVDRTLNTTTTPPYSTTSVSPDGFAAHYGGGSLGAFATNASVQNVGGTFGNGKCMQLLVDPSLAQDPNNWSDIQTCTPGAANGGDNTTYIDSLQNGPLLVDMLSFEITSMEPGQGVEMTWQTAAEMDNVGFKVYAAKLGPGGNYRTGDSLSGLIPAKGDAFRGNTYTWTDPTPYVEGESRGYFVTDVDVEGFETPHGPVWTALPANFTNVDEWQRYNF
ncbi:hypothetical protein KQI84_07250 [bacterium]|nr:hypothetical protein [bacterium]